MNSAHIQRQGRRVLVADDEGSVRSLVAAIIERRFGCRVDTASNGDEALDMLAGEVFRRAIRSNDAGFRYGGDEFAVILDGADAKVGEIVAERIRGFFDREERFGVSMSIGVNEYAIGEGIEPFIKGTDEALYKAKSAGKNAIYVD